MFKHFAHIVLFTEGGPGKYQADLTSYDYDAPMDEVKIENNSLRISSEFFFFCQKMMSILFYSQFHLAHQFTFLSNYRLAIRHQNIC